MEPEELSGDCILNENLLTVLEKPRKAVLKKLHAGHPGQKAMLDVSTYLFWPHMHKDIMNMAKDCTRYSENVKNHIHKSTSKLLPLLTQLGQKTTAFL